MNLRKLFSLQKSLDTHMQISYDLVGKSFTTEKILALQVNIANLAAETGCYKYWEVKSSENKNELLDKYNECLCSILSIGLDKDFSDIDDISFKPLKTDITNQFLNLSIDINDFIVCSSKDHYFTLFEDFLSLGASFNFTEDEIKYSYEKNFKFKGNLTIVLS